MLRFTYIACLVSFRLESLIHLSVPDVRNYTSNGIFQCITAFVFYLSQVLAFVYCRINPLFTEVKTDMKFPPSTTWKPVGGEEVQFHSFLTSAPDGGESYTARPVERTAGIRWIGIWLSTWAILDVVKERKISFPVSILHRTPKHFCTLFASRWRTWCSAVRVATRRQAGWYGCRILSPNLRTCCSAHPSSYYRSRCSLPVIKGPVTDVDRGKEWVELYIYSLYMPSWRGQEQTCVYC